MSVAPPTECCNGVERELNNVTEKFRRFHERGGAEFAQTIATLRTAKAELEQSELEQRKLSKVS